MTNTVHKILNFEPIRNPDGSAKKTTHRIPADQVRIVYLTSDGNKSSARPFPEQRSNCVLVFAPGINPLVVSAATLSHRYESDAFLMYDVTTIDYVPESVCAPPEYLESYSAYEARCRVEGIWVDP